MKNHLLFFIAAFFLCACLTSCSEDTGTEGGIPTIVFDSPTKIYTTKPGEALTIEPLVGNDPTSFLWEMDGVKIGDAVSITFINDIPGQYYLTFTASNRYGSDSEEIRIDVASLRAPRISLQLPEDPEYILKGSTINLEPTIENPQYTEYSWVVNEQEVSKEKNYQFIAGETGSFNITFSAENPDGKDEVSFTLRVIEPREAPFSWTFTLEEYEVPLGSSVTIDAVIKFDLDAVYTWYLEGEVLQSGDELALIFTPSEAGVFDLVVRMKNSFREETKNIRVLCYADTQRYYRPRTASSKAEGAVYEYRPAPGQFMNITPITSDQQAVAYASQMLNNGSALSLGAFGGYIILTFDHSIDNEGEYNIQITGNPTSTQSEPGIVWVAQDTNGDGKPNDTWYQLKGSSYDDPKTIHNYEVTYYKPAGIGMNVEWTDSEGNSGVVMYNKNYHDQDSYYPEWIKSSSYKLKGSLLPSRTEEVSSNNWINHPFEWGYADNYSGIDRFPNGVELYPRANHLSISNAVDAEGRSIDLKFIDFVMIQTAVQANAGWLGEVSTEVCGVKDYNMLK